MPRSTSCSRQSARFLPLPELPGVLEPIAIWHRLGNPAWHQAPFYAAHPLPVPPIAYQLPVHLLAYLVPVEIANKLLLTAYALALPLALLLFARRLHRDPWLSLFAFPLVFSAAFAQGLLPF